MCNIRWHVIITSISVVDLLIEAIIGEIVVNTVEASGFFGTSVGESQAKTPWNPVCLCRIKKHPANKRYVSLSSI